MLDFKHGVSDSALVTQEEFTEMLSLRLEQRDDIEIINMEFPYSTILKWGYDEMDLGKYWCWVTFGPKHGRCHLDFFKFPNRCCPIVSAESKEESIYHSHIGTWTSDWLGKTDYDFGYEQFFFKKEADKDAFENGIRAIDYYGILSKNLPRHQWFINLNDQPSKD